MRGCVGALMVGVMCLGPQTTQRLDGQSLRGRATSTLRYVGLEPLALDTFAFSSAEPRPDGSYQVQGRDVTCTGEIRCTAYRLGGRAHALAATQDIRFTAWGLGIEGLSVSTYLRGRHQLDGAYAWPRADDAFDALLAYVQWNRTGLRLRVGRQETLSRLGFASFDGASVLAASQRGIRVEAFAGRSLARGLREPQNEALRGLEDWLPLNEAFVMGGVATLRSGSGASVKARFQREVWSDGSTLLSERASLEAGARLFGKIGIEASGDWDFGRNEAGKASLYLRAPVTRWLTAQIGARRYVPYFDLSTIWGFFEPVAYGELRVRLGINASEDWSLWASTGRRTYEDASTVSVLDALEDAGWTVDAGFAWRPDLRWTVSGTYRLEWGAGAYLQSGDAALGLRVTDRLAIQAHGTMFQQLEEFRLGDRRMAGGGLSAGFEVGSRTRVDGGWLHYAVLGAADTRALIGPQSRAWLSLTLPLGADPGIGGTTR